MCGITGILNLSKTNTGDIGILNQMAGYLNHRGPDQSGSYYDDYFCMAQNRLSIIDLEGGAQPIYNEDKSLWIIFNGEIYNFIELKKGLIDKGHRFYTHSDSEVIVHLYEDEKENCLQKLNGQFAFVIWDSEKKDLFAARDRVGKKPFYYTIYNKKFYFGSEIKSIFACPEIKREIDLNSLNQLFTFWTTLPGKTFYKNIFELPAGYYLKSSRENFQIKQYWDFGFVSNDELIQYNSDEIAEQVKELLLDSVGLRLRADVPVGSYLSGGLDSSSISSLTERNFNNKLKTFGVLFEAKIYDEGEYQNEMVNNSNVEHRSIIVRNKEIGALFPDMLWYSEIPLLRLSPVPLFILSRLVNKSGFKVVLTGEGGDEVFGGYNIFRETLVRAFWGKYPESQIRPLLLGRLYPYILKDEKSKLGLQSFFRAGIEQPANPFFSHLIRWQNTSKIKKFFIDDIKKEIVDYDPLIELSNILPEGFHQWDNLSRAQYLEMKIFMSNYLLSSQGDRVAMAHSVELRMPYLDYRLIEFMAKVPSYLKILGLNEKYILKKVFKDILPDSIMKRPKHPYRAPIKESLLNNNLDYIDYYLSDEILKKYNLFNPGMVLKLKNKLSNQNSAGELDNMAIAGILSTQIIYDKFIENFDTSFCKPVEFDVIYDFRSKTS